VLDLDESRARQASDTHGCPIFDSLEHLAEHADAAVVATPTITHADVACRLMELGLDVLVEKPIAHEPVAARRLVDVAARLGRILQIGHLERFNPAVIALESVITTPLFFEVHRMSEFSPRSLDVDVVLDLMIHDLDIVLSLVGSEVASIDAVGVPVLTGRVDIANARVRFDNGCIANLTASRISRDRVRKIRFFQPHAYLSIDYTTQKLEMWRLVNGAGPMPAIEGGDVAVTSEEPLKRELVDFVDAVVHRRRPVVTGQDGRRALALAQAIADKMASEMPPPTPHVR
jgi:predicted dehydrogenase